MGFSLFSRKNSATPLEQKSSDSTDTVNGMTDEHNKDNESNYVEYSTKHNLNKVFGANASKWIYPAKDISRPGGEYELSPGLESSIDNICRWMYIEWKRPKGEYTIFDPEGHRSVPEWIIDKNIAIDGTPLTEAEVKAPNRYEGKYAKELALADVHMAFKQKRFREENILSWNWLSRLSNTYGLKQPISQQFAEELTQNSSREKENQKERDTNNNSNNNNHHPTKETKNAIDSASPPASSESLTFMQTLSKQFVPTRGTLLQPAEHEASWSSPWEILLESVSSGKPLIKVANQYRPHIDFYSIDGFIDSAPSFIWFWCKFGFFIGLAQGAVVGFSAIKSEYMYFYASGLNPFTFLNSSIIAGMLKWGGNYSAFAIAFCIGDRLVHKCKQYLLPTPEQNVRTCANYVAGMTCVGATVGVMPWWLLNDYQLAGRMAISGTCVGGLLSVILYYGIMRMTSINMELYDATDRDWRRYEALMLRQRNWRETEKERKKRRTATDNWI